MAVELTATDATFTGTGLSSTYGAQVYANSSDQIKVYVDGILKTIGDDYVLNDVGSASGVSVVANFTLGSTVYIQRSTVIKQLVDTQNNETILEDVLDLALDKLTMIAQEISAKSDAALAATGFSVPVIASEAILKGAPINIYVNDGVAYARKASAASINTAATGFAAANILSGAHFNAALGGYVPGINLGAAVGEVFLDDAAPGGYTLTSPVTSGHISQSVGVYIPTIGIIWSLKQAILL